MTVHLARKWRSKNFNELVGQELSVRLLKNSLFKRAFFPAYLFSGLRGSGKTSMGRIFAAAVNCVQLDAFTRDPQATVVPCGVCVSCRALYAGQHPDFIEIDAASHTGVDNMRQIIESASLLPTLGTKKIYLIDEAHMLSKAAFNACLKILEEPPLHVMFILATTDPDKIIDTIKSRSFQVFFDPIPALTLVAHLRSICKQEDIACDDLGLGLIVDQSGGSVRDALTTLERVALAENKVDNESVSRVLGLVSKAFIIELLEYIKQGDASQLLSFLQRTSLLQNDAYAIWRELTDHIRGELYSKQTQEQYDKVIALLRISYETEQLLAKTGIQSGVIEYMLVRMCGFSATAPAIAQVVPVVAPIASVVPTPPVVAPDNGLAQQFRDIIRPHIDQTQSKPTTPQPIKQITPKQATPAAAQTRSARSETIAQALKIFPGTITEV